MLNTSAILKSSIQNKILKTLSDERPITAIQIVENLEKCPRGFYPVSRTYDQDSDADLKESSIFNRSSRYLCLSKTEGIPNFVVEEILILNAQTSAPKGFSLLSRTADSGQRAWKKKQVFYKLANQREAKAAITDIIICSRLKKAPSGFSFAGEINGVLLCYKMGNQESSPNGDSPGLPPKPNSAMYPNLVEDTDQDYIVLRPGMSPTVPVSPTGPLRPAPRPPGSGPGIPPVSGPVIPPFQHQNSTHNTLGSGFFKDLEGVPFVVNPKFSHGKSGDGRQGAPIKIKTMQQILREYDYSFTTEKQAIQH